MSNYYLFEIESIVQTFTVLDTGKEISFGYSSPENQECFGKVNSGDVILGYYNEPIDEVKIVFEVKEHLEEDQIELVKKLEVQDGVSITSEIADELRQKKLVSIYKEKFDEIYGQMLKKIKQPVRNNDTVENFDLEKIIFTAPKLPISWNYLVFGAPGTGKSHELKKIQEKYFADKNSYERVTFYSNYSYANFVGTYKPKMDGKDIVYSYVPGPFIRILEKAYKNPDKNFLLVIEEINRANPAATFGDIFQLLDRKNGRSEYSIETSEELKLFFTKKFVSEFDEMSDEEKDTALDSFSKMYIPPNMYIWATMNSADQGVYPMDTAFKRRWDFKYIGINDNMEAMQKVTFKIALSAGEQKVNWNKLRMKINDVLSGSQCRVNEDKLLGPYFISGEVMAINKDTHSFDESKFDNEQFIDAFKNKVLMYLFEDAAKQRKTEIFKGCDEATRFSAVCEAFDKKGVEIFGHEIADSVIEE